MTKDEYMKTQIELIEIGKRISLLRLHEFVEMISHSETAGPIVDPTLWRRASDNLRSLKRFAECLMRPQVAFAEFQQKVVNTAVAEFERKQKNV